MAYKYKKIRKRMNKLSLICGMIAVFLISLLFFFVTNRRVSITHLSNSGAAVLGWDTQSELQKKMIIDKRLEIADGLLSMAPNPIKEIHLEGTVDKDVRRVRSVSSLTDMGTIFNLAYAYKTTKEPKYLDKATEFILAWATTYKATGNSINESQLQPLYDGYVWIRPSMDPKDIRNVDRWLNTIAEAEKNKKYNDGKDINNWNSYRISIIGQIGYITKTQKFINYASTAYKEQIQNNLRPDGTSFDLETRDALEYHCYNLLALLRFAKVSRQHGHDLYTYQSPSGSSLKKSLHYIFPYVNGEKIHLEYVNSVVEWDRIKAAANNQSTIGRQFEPKSALETLELAYYLDEDVLPLVQELRGNYTSYPSFQILFAEEQRNDMLKLK